ncbi:MAG: type III pantothenate kinase [Anaerolineae bacterium]
MAFILLFDIGNQHINIGVFDGEERRASWRVSTRLEGTPDEYALLLRNLLRQLGAPVQFEGGAIASSVPPIVSTFQQLCQQQFNWSPLVVGPGVKTGVRIRTDNPREVGADRVANALAAKRLYGVPAIVIDFSGPTVFDAINAEGDYVGSAIAPGIAVSADALFRSTAQLLRVELAPPNPPQVIGKNTINSVQAGLVYGYASLVEGMIVRLKKELGAGAQVIATGEQVHLIMNETGAFDVVDEHLTLQGLRLIYEMNHKT